jgi:hypothetical protein
MIQRNDPPRPQFAPGTPVPGVVTAQGEPDPKPAPYRPALGAGGAMQGVDAPRHVLASVDISQWKGMNSNMNPHILRDQYTAYQYNVMSVVHGQAQVRGGLAPVTYEEA